MRKSVIVSVLYPVQWTTDDDLGFLVFCHQITRTTVIYCSVVCIVIQNSNLVVFRKCKERVLGMKGRKEKFWVIQRVILV